MFVIVFTDLLSSGFSVFEKNLESVFRTDQCFNSGGEVSIYLSVLVVFILLFSSAFVMQFAKLMQFSSNPSGFLIVFLSITVLLIYSLVFCCGIGLVHVVSYFDKDGVVIGGEFWDSLDGDVSRNVFA